MICMYTEFRMTHGACQLSLIWHISKDGALLGILAPVTFHLLHSAQLIMSAVAAYKFDSGTDDVSATFCKKYFLNKI